MSQTAPEKVLGYFMQRLEVPASELAEHFQMPRSTLAGVLSKLEKRGAIFRSGTSAGGGGRPSQKYRLRLTRPVAVCQFDGTQLAGALFDEELTVRAENLDRLDQIADADQAAERAGALLEKLLSAANLRRSDLGGAAVAVNAVWSAGRIVASSVLPWARDGLEERFSSALGLPVKMSSLPGLLAEYQRLPYPPPRSLVHLRVGDGVSARGAFFGRPHYGGSSLAGELGHVIVDPKGPLCGCGRKGCLEAYCSGPAIHKRVLSDLGTGVVCRLDRQALLSASPREAIEQIRQAWKAGDNYVGACMEEVFDRLAWGLGLVMNLFDPELITFGGYVFGDKAEWLEEVRRRSERWTLRPAGRKTRFESARASLEDELRITAAGFCFEERLP